MLPQKTTQSGDLHRLSVLNEAVFRQGTYINKKAFLSAAITAAIENNTCDKASAFHIILKLTRDIAGKILSTAGIGVVFVHIRPKIAVQCALGLFIGSLVKVAGVCFTQ